MNIVMFKGIVLVKIQFSLSGLPTRLPEIRIARKEPDTMRKSLPILERKQEP